MSAHKHTCLIIDNMHPSIMPMLEEIGVEAVYAPDIQPEEVKARLLEGFEGLILRSKLKVTKELLQHAPQLRYVARAGAGLDNVDEAYLQERNITLLSAPEGNRDAVGEFTLGLMLSLFRNISKSSSEVRQYVWDREGNRGEEVSGKTIGIIGYGNMGRAFAKRLAGFDCRVLANDKKFTSGPDSFAELTTLDHIFREADVVSLHIPLTPENYRFADAHFFQAFRKPVWVLNTSRGEVLDHAALITALQEGIVKGAALDVLENEKLHTLNQEQQQHFEYLASSHKVLLTPHIAGWTYESYEKINQALVRKIKSLL